MRFSPKLSMEWLQDLPGRSTGPHAAWSVTARVQRWFDARLPLADHHRAGQRNIYIVPTGAGLVFGALLAVLLLTSINYQLSLGYVLTFLLSGSALASMHMTHATLRGLRLHLRAGPPAFAGGHADLEITLDNPGARRHGIGLGWRDQTERAWTDVPAHGLCSLHLPLPLPQRGWQPVPALVAETRFPMGLFRAWTVWRPAARVLAWPRPEHPAPPLPLRGGTDRQAPAAASAPLPARAADEVAFDGVRPWRSTDTWRQVAWKKVARTGELVSREAAAAASGPLWLDEAAARSPEGDAEQGLSRLAAWVLAAERAGLAVGLRLGGHEWAAGSGEAHRRALLDALGAWQPAPRGG